MKRRVLFVSGIRAAESRRRMGYGDELQIDGRAIWCNPLIYWTCDQRDLYIEANRLPHNRVSDLLGISGECLCGAYAGKGERQRIRQHFPETEAHIAEIEARCRDVGVHAVWGTRPPKCKATVEPKAMPLCVGCENRRFGDDPIVVTR